MQQEDQKKPSWKEGKIDKANAVKKQEDLKKQVAEAYSSVMQGLLNKGDKELESFEVQKDRPKERKNILGQRESNSQGRR